MFSRPGLRYVATFAARKTSTVARQLEAIPAMDSRTQKISELLAKMVYRDHALAYCAVSIYFTPSIKRTSLTTPASRLKPRPGPCAISG